MLGSFTCRPRRKRRRRRRTVVAAGLVAAAVALTGAARPHDPFDRRSRDLEAALLEAVNAQHFDQVVDFGPVEGACPGSAWCPRPAATIAHPPNIDLAVIALDRSGRPRAAADVLFSRDYPDGVGVAIGDDLGTDAVRWRRWNPDRWNGGTFSETDGSRTTTVGWKDNPALGPADDIVPGRDEAPLEFMSPYPASTFKLMVAFHTLRLVDRGRVDLDRDYRYVAADGSTMIRSTRELLDRMITESDNDSAKALLKQLHDLGEVEPLNQSLHDLGLGTLQVQGTDPATGAKWGIGQITMTSLDTARLLLLINGGPGVLWRTPAGKPVRAADVLSRDSRAIFLGMLADQGWNDILTTSNWCGRAYPTQGIPSLVADRWVDPGTGTVTVADKAFGQDVRPCNERAEVSFAHKTGFTYNYLSDAGIVRSFAGPRGDYIVVMMSNLGYRYADPRQGDATQPVCDDDPANDVGVCYTEKFAALGSAVDAILRRR
ncbi:MAG TPA: serine hydrolase [Acidimicrobiia bacterium]|nr:serine hydrolase [Acidimicrobiia bacterium]